MPFYAVFAVFQRCSPAGVLDDTPHNPSTENRTSNYLSTALSRKMGNLTAMFAAIPRSTQNRALERCEGRAFSKKIQRIKSWPRNSTSTTS